MIPLHLSTSRIGPSFSPSSIFPFLFPLLTLLFLIPSLAPRGAERALVNLVNSLDQERYHVTVQTLFDVGELRDELASHVEYRGGLPFLFRGNVQLMKLFTPAQLYRMVVRRRYDVVVAYLEGTCTRIISGCPYPDSRKVAWVHIEQPDVASFAYCYRSREEAVRCYHLFDQIVAVSQTVKACIDSFTGRSAKVIHNLIDSQRILQLAKASMPDLPFSTTLNLVSVGALTHQKGYDRLLEVHHKLLMTGIPHHVYVIGGGGEEAALRHQIETLGVSDTFHLLGRRTNPYPYLAAADLFVCSSRQEGYSTAVTEALILGLPVVSTQCSGAEELLGPQDEYGLVTANSSEGLYNGIMRILTTPDLLQHYAKQAKLRASYLTVNDAIAEHEALFCLCNLT